MGPRHHLSFCSCNTAWLAPEQFVSMGPSTYLLLLHAKRRDLHQNDKSIWVPALICGFWLQNSVFWYRNLRLYGSQTSPVAVCSQNIVSGTRIKSLCGSQTSPAVMCMQNSVRSTRITSLYGSQTSPVVFGCKTVTFGLELQVSVVPRPHLWFLACKTPTFGPE